MTGLAGLKNTELLVFSFIQLFPVILSKYEIYSVHELKIETKIKKMAIRPLKGTEFKTVLENGKRRKYQDLVAYVAKSEADTSAFGLSVGKKFGSAVERNRIKRQCRALFRENSATFSAGSKVVLIIRPPVKAYSKAQLRTVFFELFGIPLYSVRRVRSAKP